MSVNKCFALLILGFITLCACASHAAVQTWGTSEDWHCDDPCANPANDWAYGYKTSATGSFVPFDFATCTSAPQIPDYSYWGLMDPWGYGGNVHKNVGDAECGLTWAAVLEAQETSAHPGQTAGQNPTFRWIAPATVSGKYLLWAEFTGNDYGTPNGTSTDVHVVRNNNRLFDGEVLGYKGGKGIPAYGPSPVQTYIRLLTLQPNDTIDFVVGFGEFGYFNDMTGVHGLIQEIPPPLVWFRADLLLSDPNNAIGTDPNIVEIWEDLSGNENDAVREFGKPKLTTAIFGNGEHPVVSFDTTEGGDGLWLTDSAALEISSLSIYLVSSIETGSQDQIIFANASGAGSGYSLGISSTDANYIEFTTSTGGDITSANTLTADRQYIITATMDGAETEKKLYLNGAQEASASGSATYTGTQASIGVLDSGSKYLTGKIAEILVYDSVDSEQKAIIETYLSLKYGIELRYCGDADTVYLDGDINNDCYVDINDVAEIAKQWLQCTDPSGQCN